jgi:hypothetical protein
MRHRPAILRLLQHRGKGLGIRVFGDEGDVPMLGPDQRDLGLPAPDDPPADPRQNRRAACAIGGIGAGPRAMARAVEARGTVGHRPQAHQVQHLDRPLARMVAKGAKGGGVEGGVGHGVVSCTPSLPVPRPPRNRA